MGWARRMSLTGDCLVGRRRRLRAGLVTEVVAHAELLPAARRVATAIVGNNQKGRAGAVGPINRIDAEQTSAALWLEAEAARAWMRSSDGRRHRREPGRRDGSWPHQVRP